MPFLGSVLASWCESEWGSGNGRQSGEHRAVLTLPRRKRDGRRPGGPAPDRRGLVRNAALVAVALVLLVAGAVIVTVTSPDRQASDFPSFFRPISMSFPWSPVGAKVERPLIVTNTRRSPITLTGLRITGPAQDDFSAPVRCLRRLSPGQSCTITVRYTPSASGLRAAELLVSFSAWSRPQGIGLTAVAYAKH
jgi:Abnormal spindle-like microcephaly-assoc'd, ASPM-SPD-2-Hydin